MHNENVNGQRIKVYDNGGKTADRYTVVYLDQAERSYSDNVKMYTCLGMSERPFHPQGFGQHSIAQVGSHLGKRISFADLPLDCQKAVLQDTTVTQ